MDSLEVTGFDHQVTRAEVSLDVTHSFVGDLRVSLMNGSEEVTLFDREQLTGSLLQRRFTLRLPVRFDPNRVWTLSIADLESGDEGRLNSWSISFSRD